MNFNKISKPIYECDTPVEDLYSIEPSPLYSKSPKIEKRTKNADTVLDVFVQELREQLDNVEENKVVEIPKVELSKMSEEIFWTHLEKLDWKDKPDGLMNQSFIKAKIRSNLNNAELVDFKKHLDDYVRSLETKFSKRGIFSAPKFDDSESGKKNKRDLLSHIVARGSVMYSLMSEDPPFANYLINDDSDYYQSLYDCLP